MKFVAAYLLATLGGNASPSEADVKKILSSVGADADADSLNKVLSALSGKNIEEVISEGSEKLASVPTGAGGAAPSGGAASGGDAPAEEEEEEEEESSSDAGLGGLF
eukprot:CAMPEP_0117424602 /NCGR_PEP_ID=MMETSP0758-20121206/4986_1 /TAXON_ID=63605 /ORGANISM="Percolomonas cosmopolitus, Strain AE-1 (ATCC 50343)" /LENGTH=106 /DNA_ID=CAMNT_0005208475 /DNA_START=161 /DNA_END=481 /DNA_ORIENTATION=-